LVPRVGVAPVNGALANVTRPQASRSTIVLTPAFVLVLITRPKPSISSSVCAEPRDVRKKYVVTSSYS
jgi:hypothetical protein